MRELTTVRLRAACLHVYIFTVNFAILPSPPPAVFSYGISPSTSPAFPFFRLSSSYLSLYLSLYLSIYLSLSFSLFLFVILSLFLPLYLSLFCLSLCLSSSYHIFLLPISFLPLPPSFFVSLSLSLLTVQEARIV